MFCLTVMSFFFNSWVYRVLIGYVCGLVRTWLYLAGFRSLLRLFPRVNWPEFLGTFHGVLLRLADHGLWPDPWNPRLDWLLLFSKSPTLTVSRPISTTTWLRSECVLVITSFWMKTYKIVSFALLTCSAKWHKCCAKRLKWHFRDWMLVLIQFARFSCVVLVFVEYQKLYGDFCTSQKYFLTV